MAKSNLQYVICCDFETSGLPKGEKKPFWDVLAVEFAAVVVDLFNMSIVCKKRWLIAPYLDNYVWEQGAQEKHGYTEDYLRSAGQDVKEVAKEVRDLFNKYKNKYIGTHLAGHNFSGFDMPFLKGLFEAIDDDVYKYVRYVFDTQFLAYLRAVEQENFKLGTCCRLEGVELVNAHHALDDTIGNAKLFLKYVELMRGVSTASANTVQGFKKSRFREKFQLV